MENFPLEEVLSFPSMPWLKDKWEELMNFTNFSRGYLGNRTKGEILERLIEIVKKLAKILDDSFNIRYPLSQ